MAWPSIRERILENLKTTFQGITVLNGYNLDVGFVSRDLIHPNQLTDSQIPAIFITATRAVPAHMSYTKLRTVLMPTITCYVSAASNATAATTLEKLFQDIRKVIYVDIRRAGLAESTLAGETRVDKGTLPPMAGGEIDLEISYRHPRDEP